MKRLRHMAALLCVCLLALFISACKPHSAPLVHTVTVVVDGVQTRYERQEGDALTLEDPHKSGFDFDGYYDGEVRVSFPYTVTEDVTLTARFSYAPLAERIADALRVYLASDEFAASVSSAKTAAAWLPLAYLRYVQGDFYTDANAALFRKYMNMLPELIEEGELSDYKWNGSAAQAQGWYGILDYLYTYSIAANAYKEYLHGKGLTDNTFDVYSDAIARYLERADAWESGGTKNTYQVGDENIYQINLAAKYSRFSNMTSTRYAEMPSDYVEQLLAAVQQATGSDRGHADFLADYATLQPRYEAILAEQERIAPLLQPLSDRNDALNVQYSELNAQYRAASEEDKPAIKAQMDEVSAERTAVNAQIREIKGTLNTLEQQFTSYANGKDFAGRYKSFLPVTQVSFGMTAYSYLAIVRANLALNAELPYTDATVLGYYAKDDNGEFTRKGGTPNWVGPSGRPVAASLYRDYPEYDVDFEKYRQGYFPFTDGWNQPLEEMITLDTLGKYYNHELETGANVTPEWAVLTGYMHGIDMEHYTVARPVEGEPTEYNIITLWRETLTAEGDKYVIDNNIDLAVAIAYLAYIQGIDAPTPLGAYDAAEKVIVL